MTQMQWVVEQSLMQDERFRHLTVMLDPKLDFVDIDAKVYGMWQDDPEGMRKAKEWARQELRNMK